MASNIWRPSVLYKRGNPSIHNLKYQSVTEVNREKKIRKCEIGRSFGRYLPEKVVMFVGETGTGKTSTINTVVNYLFGVQWENDKRYQIVTDAEERKGTSQTFSQTKWISSFTFHHTKIPNCKVTLVDTPGYGNTDGKEYDNFITSQVREFFGRRGDHEIDHIDAVAFVVKESSLRLTDTQKYIFDCVFHLFGKDIRENVFVFITHADYQNILGEDVKNVPVVEAIKTTNVHPKGYVFCNNSVLFAQKTTERNSEVTPIDAINKVVWNKIQGNLDKFFVSVDECQSKSIVLCAVVLNDRKTLEVTVKGLPVLIRRRLVELGKMKREAEILEEYADKINSNHNFSYEVREPQLEEVMLEGNAKATICNRCHMTCHYPCGTNIFKKAGVKTCSMLKSPHCVLCNCKAEDHETGSKKYEFHVVTVTKTNPYMMEAHNAAKLELDNREKVLRDIFEKQKLLYQTIEGDMERLQRCLERLCEISLKPNPDLILQELKHFIEREMADVEPQLRERVRDELKRLYKRGEEMVKSQLDQSENRNRTKPE